MTKRPGLEQGIPQPLAEEDWDNDHQFMDITGAKAVQIQVRNDGSVIWVNVDGICRLRVCQVEMVEVEDDRSKKSVYSKAVQDCIDIIDESTSPGERAPAGYFSNRIKNLKYRG